MTSEMIPLPLTLIVAATRSNAIGRSSSLPWRLSNEMAYFARITKGESSKAEEGEKNVVVMGRKSWEGIPKKFRPLQGRRNVVVSRQEGYDLGDSPLTELANSLESAISLLRPTSSSSSSRRTFLIGGAQLYNEALLSPSSSSYSIDRVLLTRILTDYSDCDTFLHPFTEDPGWTKASHEELKKWAGWEVPEGTQREKDKAYKGEGEKMVEYVFEMWVRGE
ncbi:dihydrofolate reductase [Sporobolomyces salmoneus]|uniref:dihydrofolate reductase n=1 Tax=Sporobolomyces salmoneus TaxID=183962 RepID=UPI00317FAFD1